MKPVSKKKTPPLTTHKPKKKSVESKTAVSDNPVKIAYSSETNCLTCRLFVSCTKPKKAFNYVCDKHKTYSRKLNIDNFLEIQPEPSAKTKNKKEKNSDTEPSKTKKYKIDNITDEDDAGFNVERLIQEIEAEHAKGIPPDLKIDDRDLKEAPNFFTFATDPAYLGYKPYPKQLEIGLQYYNDWCTNKKCTDVHYALNMPTDAYDASQSEATAIYEEILDRVTLLNYGKCPKCGETRADGWRRGIYHPYTEMAILAGQRCVAFDTYCLTEQGMVKIGELFEGVDFGFTPTELMVDNGTGSIVTATKLYKAHKERPYKITFTDGTRLTGTADHPILTIKGMTKLSVLPVGQYIPIYLGQECWGPNSLHDEELDAEVSSHCMSYALRTSDRETNIRYINKLFDSHGYITDGRFIAFKFNILNHVHAEQLKFVLQNLGIASYIKAIGPRFDLCIEGQAILKMIFTLKMHHRLLTEDILYKVSDYVGYNDAPFIMVRTNDSEFKHLGNPNYWVQVKNVEYLETPCQTYDFYIPEGHKFFSNGIVSHNSGKSAITAIMATYTLHRYIKLQNAPKVFSLFKNTTLHGVFIATTFAQAKDSLFDPINDLIHDSEWYIRWHELLDHYGRKHGEELYKFKETIIDYKPRKLVMYPSVPNKRSLRGRSLFCLTGDTLVTTDRGLLPISQDLTGLTTTAFKTPTKIIKWTPAGTKSVTKITTKFGYHIKGTADHKIKVLNKQHKLVWRRIDALKLGDLVTINHGNYQWPKQLPLEHTPQNRIETGAHKIIKLAHSGKQILRGDLINIPNFGRIVSKLVKNGALNKKYLLGAKNMGCVYTWSKKYTLKEAIDLLTTPRRKSLKLFTLPTVMTPELATMLGYMVYEGSYAKNTWEFSFSNTDLRVVKHFADCYRSVFNSEPRIGGPYVKNNSKNKPYYKIIIGIKEFKDFFRYLGLSPSVAHTKTMPWSILQADKLSTKAFLTAYFEGDGYLQASSQVNAVSCSKKLLIAIQLLLLKFGIISAISSCNRPLAENHHKQWAIDLSVYDSCLFVKRIGFYTKNRDINSKRLGHTKHWTVPNISWKSKDRKGYHNKQVFFVKRSMNKFYGIHRMSWLKQQSPDAYATAHRLTGKGLLWLPVTKINKLNKKIKVYDITVNSDEHVFTGNGILLHNCGSVDEIGHFDATKGTAIKLNADEIHIAMKRSFLSVSSAIRNLRKNGAYNIPEPLFSNISSPVSRFDKICRLVDDSKNSKTVMSRHFSVYQMNPTITPEDLEDERRNNPEGYRRDYLAIPPRASSAFIHDTKIVRSCIDPKHRNMLAIKQKTAITASGSEYTKGWTKFVRRDSSVPRLLAIDAGEKDNGFAFALLSMTPDNFPRVDGLGELTPEPGKPLNFNNVYEKIIKPIIENCNVKFICADRWNSASILSNAEAEYEIGQMYHTLQYAELIELRTAMTDVQVVLPKNEIKIKDAMTLSAKNYPFSLIGNPVAHFVVQCLTVEEVLGKSVIKGEKKTDDLFRAFALGYTKIMDPEIRELYMDTEVRAPRSGVIGVSASLGSGGGNNRGSGMGGNASRLGAVGSIGAVSTSSKAGSSRIFAGR